MGIIRLASTRVSATIAAACLLPGAVCAQTTGVAVQQMINDAVATGQATLTLPAGPIVLSTSLQIPGGTRNLTIVGQSGTKLVRSSSADFPLLTVGNAGWHGFENSASEENPKTGISPAAEGDQNLTRTGGINPAPGWYIIVGIDPVLDTVRHSSGNTTYWFKRELVRVTAVNGNQIRLAQPLGRAFSSGELRLIEPENATGTARTVIDNVTIRNISFDGRSPTNGAYSSKCVVAGLAHNLVFDDVSVMGYSTAGISVMMSKGVTVSRARISDGNLNSMGYGIEFIGTRFATVRGTTFLRTRTGIVLQSGNMDVLVEDCSAPTAGFDVGHGTGETRITYRRTVGTSFGIANPSWRRGVDRVLLEDCTATSSIHVYGGASNVVIRGKHPSYPQTTPVFHLYTDSGGAGNPAGASYVQSLTLENGVSTRGDLDGVNMQFTTISNTPRMLGNLTIRNWTFTNLVTELGANLNLSSISNSPNIVIEDSTLRNSALWSAPVWLGPNANGSEWYVTFRNTKLQSAGTCGLLLETGARANIVNQATTFNGGPFTNANVRGAVGLRNPL